MPIPLGDIGDVAGIASAVIAGAQLMLGGSGQGGEDEDQVNAVQGALLLLHDRLYEWLSAAARTNEAAHRWRRGLPGTAGSAAAVLEVPAISNIGAGRAVARTMRQRVELRSGRRRSVARTMRRSMELCSDRRWDVLRVRPRSRDPELVLRSLLRAHATGIAADVDMVLWERGEILRSLPEELERRYAMGGKREVDILLSSMDDTLRSLADACRQLADFIRTRFPIESF